MRQASRIVVRVVLSWWSALRWFVVVHCKEIRRLDVAIEKTAKFRLAERTLRPENGQPAGGEARETRAGQLPICTRAPHLAALARTGHRSTRLLCAQRQVSR